VTEIIQRSELRSDKGIALVEYPVAPHSLHREWQVLCAHYLPLTSPGSTWRHSRGSKIDDPEQGWKLHISATILTAVPILKAVGPFLKERGIHFKAAASLDVLGRLNSGLHYGYSQVGKFITVYATTEIEAQFLAEHLHYLTRDLHGPAVPFDEQFQRPSCISYRYGSFKALKIENANGTSTFALRDPQGNLVPDQRDAVKPSWVPNLFSNRFAVEPVESPLKTTYRVFQALLQRGKGGVYKAVDFGNTPPRFCLIKEGRLHGETNWDGRDGRERVGNEENVLSRLRASGVEVPVVYDSFEVEHNYYLVTEFIEGMTLQALLSRRRRRLTSVQVVKYIARLAELLSRIHAAGWAWRDCKPTNIIITKTGTMRPLDFEGACPIAEPDSDPWGTPGYVPPEWQDARRQSLPEAQDLYALGAITYLLVTGILPTTSAATPAGSLRRNVDPTLLDIIRSLLDAEPRKRPSAIMVAAILNQASRRAGAPILQKVAKLRVQDAA
jgi:hypothetical protein